MLEIRAGDSPIDARASADTLEFRSIIWPFRAIIRGIYPAATPLPPSPGTVFPLPFFFTDTMNERTSSCLR